MRKIMVGIILLCSTAAIAFAQGDDNTTIQEEKWVATVTDHVNRCKNIGINFSGTHNFLVLIKTDQQRVIYDSTSGITYYGKFNSENPHIIYYTASYRKEAGVLSEEIVFNRQDDNHGKGKSVWYWSDGLMHCGGEYSFTGTRKK
jgi:hypothetical protein